MAKQNFQRKGNKTNAAIGSAFEIAVKGRFEPYVNNLQRPFKIPIGLAVKKPHAFDFGNDEILVNANPILGQNQTAFHMVNYIIGMRLCIFFIWHLKNIKNSFVLR